jgi:hypothetical protein
MSSLHRKVIEKAQTVILGCYRLSKNMLVASIWQTLHGAKLLTLVFELQCAIWVTQNELI